MMRSSSLASAALRRASAEAMALSSVRTWAVRSSTCASVPAPDRRSGLGPVEARRDLVARGGRAAALGDRGLDVGAALLGIEGDQHVAGLDLLALCELDPR